MAPSARDRLSVDLQGLKVAPFERARLAGSRPRAGFGACLQGLWAALLGQSTACVRLGSKRDASRVRFTLRMSRADASAVLASARLAGQPPGDVVANRLAGQPAPTPASDLAETVGALIVACAELSTFSRNLSHLVSLLRQGAFRPVDENGPMLVALSHDVRQHLDHFTRALVHMQPRRGSAMQQNRDGTTRTGARP